MARLHALLQLGRHRQVVPDARRLLQHDCYNEDVWAALMISLYRSHRRADSLRSFQQAAGWLAEAGLEPSERLVDLEGRIVTQDSSLLTVA